MTVNLVWATPEGDQLVARLARVSNPVNQANDATAPRLIRYLIEHKHWSPFEMVSACVEIETTRDIGRQILRHRSFAFQEFSQRYAEVTEFAGPRPARLRGATNRQSSVACEDEEVARWWVIGQNRLLEGASMLYAEAIRRGIAPEVARAVLPEGLTGTRMYMAGSLRSWIHYLGLRLNPATQAEHRLIAEEIYHELMGIFPMSLAAAFDAV